MFVAVGEREAGTGDKIDDGTRHEHFAGLRQGGNSGADVDCDTADVVGHELDFARMKAGAHSDSKFGRRGADRVRASNPSRWTIERH
jgi:hypothetical protein